MKYKRTKTKYGTSVTEEARDVCPECGGEKWIQVERDDVDEFNQPIYPVSEILCPECNGTGKKVYMKKQII